MRTLSAAALAALNSASPKFFLLAEIQTNPVLKITSTPFNLTYPTGSLNTYSAINTIVGFGPPRVSSSIDREIYELTFLDHDNFFQSQLREGITGKLLTVYAGFFSSSDVPLLESNDVLIAYQGFIDSGKIINDGSSKLGIITAASPMAALDSIGGYIVSKDGMDQISSIDTSFDDIYVGGKSVTLKWGKS
jgi:hypothetical protein